MIFRLPTVIELPARMAWKLPRFTLAAPSATREDVVVALVGHLMGPLGEKLARDMLASAAVLGTLDAQVASLFALLESEPPKDIEERLRVAS